MRKIVLILFAFTLALCSNAQQVQAVNTVAAEDVLKLKETEHNFDKIPQGKPVYYSFDITNTGKTALKLDDVHASCGCTTPEWSREEIAPGATAKIKVGYNAAAEGHLKNLLLLLIIQIKQSNLLLKALYGKHPKVLLPSMPQ